MFYIDGHEKIHIFQPFFSSFGGGTLLCRPQGGGGIWAFYSTRGEMPQEEKRMWTTCGSVVS